MNEKKQKQSRFEEGLKRADKIAKTYSPDPLKKIVLGEYRYHTKDSPYQLVAYESGDRQNNGNKIGLFLTGNIHPDEPDVYEGVLRIFKKLCEYRDILEPICIVPIVNGSGFDSQTRETADPLVDINREFWVDSKIKEVKLLEDYVNEVYNPNYPWLFLDIHQDKDFLSGVHPNYPNGGAYALANSNPKSSELARKSLKYIQSIGIPIITEPEIDGVPNEDGVILKCREKFNGAFGPPPFARYSHDKYSPFEIVFEINHELAPWGFELATSYLLHNLANTYNIQRH